MTSPAANILATPLAGRIHLPGMRLRRWLAHRQGTAWVHSTRRCGRTRCSQWRSQTRPLHARTSRRRRTIRSRSRRPRRSRGARLSPWTSRPRWPRRRRWTGRVLRTTDRRLPPTAVCRCSNRSCSASCGGCPAAPCSSWTSRRTVGARPHRRRPRSPWPRIPASGGWRRWPGCWRPAPGIWRRPPAAHREQCRQAAVQARALAAFAACPAGRGAGPARRRRSGAAAAASRAARPAALTAVSEWAVDEVMAALGLSSAAAGALLQQSVTLVDQLPATLAALEAGGVSWAHAVMLADVLPLLTDPAQRADGGGRAAGPGGRQDGAAAAGGRPAGGAARRRVGGGAPDGARRSGTGRCGCFPAGTAWPASPRRCRSRSRRPAARRWTPTPRTCRPPAMRAPRTSGWSTAWPT